MGSKTKLLSRMGSITLQPSLPYKALKSRIAAQSLDPDPYWDKQPASDLQKMNADVKNAISPLPGEWCGGERAAGSLLPSLHLGGGQGAEWRQWDADSAQAAARTPGRLQVPGMSCCYSCHFKFTVVRNFFFKFALKIFIVNVKNIYVDLE